MRLSFVLLAVVAVQSAASGASTSVEETPLSRMSSSAKVASIGAVQNTQDGNRFLRARESDADDADDFDDDTNGVSSEEERGWEKAAGTASKLATSPSFKRTDDELVGLMATLEHHNLQNQKLFKQIMENRVTPRSMSNELKIADKLATTKIAQLRKDGDFMLWAQYSKFWSDARKAKPT